MAIIRMKLDDGILSENEIKELEQAEKMPITFDEDCPEMTEQMLQQFKRMDHSILINLSDSEIKTVNELGGVGIIEKILRFVLTDKKYLQKIL